MTTTLLLLPVLQALHLSCLCRLLPCPSYKGFKSQFVPVTNAKFIPPTITTSLPTLLPIPAVPVSAMQVPVVDGWRPSTFDAPPEVVVVLITCLLFILGSVGFCSRHVLPHANIRIAKPDELLEGLMPTLKRAIEKAERGHRAAFAAKDAVIRRLRTALEALQTERSAPSPPSPLSPRAPPADSEPAAGPSPSEKVPPEATALPPLSPERSPSVPECGSAPATNASPCEKVPSEDVAAPSSPPPPSPSAAPFAEVVSPDRDTPQPDVSLPQPLAAPPAPAIGISTSKWAAPAAKTHTTAFPPMGANMSNRSAKRMQQRQARHLQCPSDIECNCGYINKKAIAAMKAAAENQNS